jgi:hypothetical protein
MSDSLVPSVNNNDFQNHMASIQINYQSNYEKTSNLEIVEGNKVTPDGQK